MSEESPITRDDQWFKGEDKTFTFTVYQSDGVTAQNITGWTFSFDMWTGLSATYGSPTLSKTSASGIAIVSGAAGTVRVTINSADTLSLTAEMYHYVLRRADSGSRAVVAHGRAQLLDERGEDD